MSLRSSGMLHSVDFLVSFRRFGTACQLHFKGQAVQLDCLTFEGAKGLDFLCCRVFIERGRRSSSQFEIIVRPPSEVQHKKSRKIFHARGIIRTHERNDTLNRSNTGVCAPLITDINQHVLVHST